MTECAAPGAWISVKKRVLSADGGIGIGMQPSTGCWAVGNFTSAKYDQTRKFQESLLRECSKSYNYRFRVTCSMSLEIQY